MSLDDIFKTKTMARIFTQQGQFKKAAEIYVFLLKQNPNRKDIKTLLIDIRRRLSYPDQGGAGDLRPLYQKWVTLALAHHKGKKQNRVTNEKPA